MTVDIRIIATLFFIVGMVLAGRSHTDYDFGLPIRVGGVIILYLLFWVIYLAVT